jgi:hypothetical protein
MVDEYWRKFRAFDLLMETDFMRWLHQLKERSEVDMGVIA